MNILSVSDLHVFAGGKEIVKGASFSLEKGKVYAIMGPNGSGKSSLCNALMGNPEYKISGRIALDGKDISGLRADERARLGMFLSFQNPEEVEGVGLEQLMRRASRPADKKEEIRNWASVSRKVKAGSERLGLALEGRELNVGFSGGEKKKAEVLQMEVLQPQLVLLDEIDSGLDVDALKAAANSINSMRGPKRTFVLVTHYSRILHYVKPDLVFVMKEGRIVECGRGEIVKRIEEEGYGAI